MSETNLLVLPIFKFLKDDDKVLTGKHYMEGQQIKRGSLGHSPIALCEYGLFSQLSFPTHKYILKKIITGGSKCHP